MKYRENLQFVFCCDDCKKIASMDPSEKDALRTARDVSTKYGWLWKHPGWQMYCPNCKGTK